MTDLLLITDVPRLLKVFSPLAEERDLRLRIATNLEKGAEELVAEKPGIVFVQTHLSGLSAEILLMHLKKQLGRRRSRFVLLCPGDQLSGEAVKLYHGHIDTALEDKPLLDSVREMIKTLVAPKKKTPVELSDSAAPLSAVVEQNEELVTHTVSSDVTSFVPLQYEQERQPEAASGAVPEGQTLEEQGVVYGRRPQVSVYSEFTSSFDDAVSSMPATEPLASSLDSWKNEFEAISHEAAPGRSRRGMFLLWLAPVLIAAVVITVIQHRRSQPEPVIVKAAAPSVPAPAQKAAVPAQVVAPPVVPAPVPPVVPAAAVKPQASVSPAAAPSAAAKRLTALPEFVPRYGRDKTYPAAHPGWERYKGQVTEFKVFREGETIKAIQIIDRGGNGLPEFFLKGALKQLTKAPVHAVTSTEKKGDYTIQRGQVAENISAVYYRDAEGSKLRAFVVTWQ